MAKQRLFTFVDVDDNTPIQKLTIKDQLYTLLKRATNDDSTELEAEDAATTYQLKLKANLIEFLNKSTEAVREGKHKSVTVSVASIFEPVLDEVLQTASILKFYEVSVNKQEIGYDIPYFMEITLNVKEK
ncbi:MAG: hypothetical protein LBS29_04575 [Endomicrobium sp.]|jgi:hypothetical protein|nr:hypothetical protein [Endomicrobium sp.]